MNGNGSVGFAFEVPAGPPRQIAHVDLELDHRALTSAEATTTVVLSIGPLSEASAGSALDELVRQEVRSTPTRKREVLSLPAKRLLWPGTYFVGVRTIPGDGQASFLLPSQNAGARCATAPGGRVTLAAPLRVTEAGVQRLAQSPHLSVALRQASANARSFTCGGSETARDAMIVTLAPGDSPLTYRFSLDRMTELRRVGVLAAGASANAATSPEVEVRLYGPAATGDAGAGAATALATMTLPVRSQNLAMVEARLAASLPVGDYRMELRAVAARGPVFVAVSPTETRCRQGQASAPSAELGPPVVYVTGRLPCQADDVPPESRVFAATGLLSRQRGVARWTLLRPLMDAAQTVHYQALGFDRASRPVLSGTFELDLAMTMQSRSRTYGTFAMNDAEDAALPPEQAKALWIELTEALGSSSDACGLETAPAVDAPVTQALSGVGGSFADCRAEQLAALEESMAMAERATKGAAGIVEWSIDSATKLHRSFVEQRCCMGENTPTLGASGYPYEGCQCHERFPDKPVREIREPKDPAACPDAKYGIASTCTEFLCVPCPAERPRFNPTTGACEGCPEGFVWNGTDCRKPPPPPPMDLVQFTPNGTGVGGGDCDYEIEFEVGPLLSPFSKGHHVYEEPAQRFITVQKGPFRGIGATALRRPIQLFPNPQTGIDDKGLLRGERRDGTCWPSNQYWLDGYKQEKRLVFLGPTPPDPDVRTRYNRTAYVNRERYQEKPAEWTNQLLYEGTDASRMFPDVAYWDLSYREPCEGYSGFAACSCDEPKVVWPEVRLIRVEISKYSTRNQTKTNCALPPNLDGLPDQPWRQGDGVPPNPAPSCTAPLVPLAGGVCGCPADGPPRLRDEQGNAVEPARCACAEGETWNSTTKACELGDRCLGAEGSKCTPIQRDPTLPSIIGVGSCGASHIGPGSATCVADEHYRPLPAGLQYQSVTLGSIRHDDCCIDHPNGVFCGGKGTPTPHCLTEFAGAIRDAMTDGRSWRVLFDAGFASRPGTRLLDGNQPTPYARQLLAPGGTPMPKANASFCASGDVETFAGESRCRYASNEPPTMAVQQPPVGDAAAQPGAPAPYTSCERLAPGSNWSSEGIFTVAANAIAPLTGSAGATTYGAFAALVDARLAADANRRLWRVRDDRGITQGLALVEPASDGSSSLRVETLVQAVPGAANTLLACLARWAAPPPPTRPDPVAWPPDVTTGRTHPGSPLAVPLTAVSRPVGDGNITVLPTLVPGLSVAVEWSGTQGVLWAGQPVIDIRADNNRNGRIDLPLADGTETELSRSEDEREDTWTSNNGAIFLPNVDDDEARCAPTEVGCSDASDDRVNGMADEHDITHATLRPWPSVASDEVVILRPVAGNPWWTHVRIFWKPNRPNENWRVIATPADGPQPGPDNLSVNADDEVLLPPELVRDGIELGIEALYANTSNDWDGYLDLVVEAKKALVSDRVRLRVAPLVFFDPRTEPEEIYVWDEAKLISPWYDFRSFFHGPLGGMKPGGYPRATVGILNFVRQANEEILAIGAPPSFLSSPNSIDMWLQDLFQVGYVSKPAADGGADAMVVLLATPRKDKTPKSSVVYQMRGRDIGTAAVPAALRVQEHSSADAMGNFEVIPPDPATADRYPVGRVLLGRHEPPRVPGSPGLALVAGLGPQDAVQVDTSWLQVGHVDEVVSFVPAPGSRKGWRVVVTSPALGLKITRDLLDSGQTQLYVRTHESTQNGTQITDIPITDILRTRYVHPRMVETVEQSTMRGAALVTRLRQELSAALGLEDSDFIEVPILMRLSSDDFGPPVLHELTVSPANALLLNRHYAAPVPHGPTDPATGFDHFAEAVRAALENAGLSVYFIETGPNYQSLLGNVHCATNVRYRIPRPSDGVRQWWQATGP